jgi:hypothetical protein
MTAAQEFSIAVKEYLKKLDELPKDERAAIMKEQLVRSELIDESGEFTDHYAYSREYYKRKKNGKAAV